MVKMNLATQIAIAAGLIYVGYLYANYQVTPDENGLVVITKKNTYRIKAKTDASKVTASLVGITAEKESNCNWFDLGCKKE